MLLALGVLSHLLHVQCCTMLGVRYSSAASLDTKGCLAAQHMGCAGVQGQGARKVLARGTARTEQGLLGTLTQVLDCCCCLIPALCRLGASNELIGLQSQITSTFVPVAARRVPSELAHCS